MAKSLFSSKVTGAMPPLSCSKKRTMLMMQPGSLYALSARP
jgi:hypothetical protein